MAENDNQNGGSNGFDWMELFQTVTTFFLFNLMWIFGSLFIVTIPAMTAALFAGVAPWAMGGSPYQPVVTFGKALRRYWLKATLLGLVDLVGVGVIAANLYILQQMEFNQLLGSLALGINLFVAVVLIIGNVYLWPLLILREQSFQALLKNGFRLAILHPFWGMLVALAAATPLVASFFLPRFFFLTSTFATTALIVHWGAWRVLRRYIDQDDIQKFGV